MSRRVTSLTSTLCGTNDHFTSTVCSRPCRLRGGGLAHSACVAGRLSRDLVLMVAPAAAVVNQSCSKFSGTSSPTAPDADSGMALRVGIFLDQAQVSAHCRRRGGIARPPSRLEHRNVVPVQPFGTSFLCLTKSFSVGRSGTRSFLRATLIELLSRKPCTGRHDPATRCCQQLRVRTSCGERPGSTAKVL